MKKLFVSFVLCLLSFRSVSSASSTEDILASPSLTIGILSAIPKESGQILEHMEGTISSEKGQRVYHPSVQAGLVLTRDKVISQEKQKAKLRENLPLALCVEMEGASVSQVCYEYGIPYVIVRTISDYANHGGIPVDITRFVNQISGHYSTNIVKNIYSLILSGYREKLE